MAKITVTQCDICKQIDKTPSDERRVAVGKILWQDVCQRCHDNARQMIQSLIDTYAPQKKLVVPPAWEGNKP